ncbi:MAG: translation initiation factor IF-2 [Clostridia bacterium]|nr:translation initiation factor IF-2 [Clostridia bacterium]
MSKKTRISELAQEINSSNKRVIELLDKIGIKVSNASSSLTEEQVEQFYESINFKRADKANDSPADTGARTAAPAQTAQSTQTAQNAPAGTIKDPRQAQPVIRKVVVHNTGKTDNSSAAKQGKSSSQAPSGLRQGLTLQSGGEEKTEPLPEVKPGGVVRRIVRTPASSGAQVKDASKDASAAAADKDAAKTAAQTAPAAENAPASETPTVVRRVRRVDKTGAETEVKKDDAPSSDTAAAVSSGDKKPAADGEKAPEKDASTAAAADTGAAKDAAADASASASRTVEKEEKKADGKEAKAAAAAPAKAADESKEVKADASADAQSTSAPKEQDAADGKTAEEKTDIKDGKKEESGRSGADKQAKTDAPKEGAPKQAGTAAQTGTASGNAQANTAASAGAEVKTPAAPARRGPVYISRAKDNTGAPSANTGSGYGSSPARQDGRNAQRTDRNAQGAQQRPFVKGKDDTRPSAGRTGGYQGEGARQGFVRDGAGRSSQGAGTGFGGQGRGRGPAIPAVNPSIAQQEPRRDYAGKLFDKVEKNQEKTQKPVSKRDATRSGSGKVKYREERNMIGVSLGVNDLLADNYHAGYDPDDTHAQKRSARTGKKDAKQAADERAAQQQAMALTNVTLPDSMTVKEFAEMIKKTAAEVIKKLMLMGTMATQNQVIDFDTAALIASEFGITAEQEVVITDEEKLFDDADDYNDPEAVERPPVVVVMGHVDHGKTSLLDAIRSTSVTAGEAGGITQHIGAYMVRIGDRKITFLDTPGHEAFTAMRQRGAMVTDVAILVVAADDGVMPQTIEAINHAKAAKVSIVVAVNKMDKEGANLERVMTEMAKYDIVSEDWGGDVPFVPVSAKTGMNIQLLLETVLLSADVLQLKANPERQAKGTIIEAKLDKNKGPVATLLVQRGTLRTGDAIVSGVTFGRVRTMTDDKGKTIKKAGPSTPVEITGLPEVPEAGELFYVVEDEHLAKHLVDTRRSEMREKSLQATTKVSLENLNSFIEAGKMKDLNIIVKADVVGSVEAVKQSLQKLSNDEVRINVIHGAVGAITESDVSLADVSNAIIIGFNVRPGANISESAKAAGVDIKLYRVIYDAIDDIKAAIAGMLSPKFQEVIHGHAQVRQTFKVSNVGTIAGAYVTDGDIVRNSEVRIVRDGIVVFEGKLASLKRFKDDVKEVATGYECGLSFENFNDIKIGDVVECYTMEEVKKA